MYCLHSFTILDWRAAGNPSPSAPVAEGPTVDPNLVFTSGAQTVVAQITLDAASRPVPTAALPPTQTTMDALPTLEPIGTPADGALPPLTVIDAATPGAAGSVLTTPLVVPTLGGLATAAPASLGGTPIPILPDKLQWVSNTPPDNSKVPAGKKFKITWKVQNIGTTTWTDTYSFKFYAGTQFATSAGFPVTKDVAPNKTMDFTVDAVAPTTPGEYYSLWVIQNADGVNFGKFDITLTVQ